MWQTEIQGLQHFPIIKPVSAKCWDADSIGRAWIKYPTRHTIIEDVHCREVIGQLEIIVCVIALPKEEDILSGDGFLFRIPEFYLSRKLLVISIVSVFIVVHNTCIGRRAGDWCVNGAAIIRPQGICVALIQERGGLEYTSVLDDVEIW